MNMSKYKILFLLLFCGSLTFAQDLVKKDTLTEIIVEKLTAEVNSPFDEIMPVLSSDGKKLYFTRVGSDEYIAPYFFKGKIYFGRCLMVDI